jgi:hypothetical protein
MNVSKKQPHELSLLIEKTGTEITEEHQSQFSEILQNLGLFSEFAGTGPVPLEAWIGIAQALADASGYRFTLEAAVVESVKDGSRTSLIVGRREIATVEPTLFVKEG